MSAALSLSEGSATASPVASPRYKAMVNSPVYGLLPDDEKPQLKARLGLCERIDSAKNRAEAIRQESTRLHCGQPLSHGAIHKLYYDKWLAGGRDWQKLINRSRVPERDIGLAPETIAHWHQLCNRYMGRMLAAWRQLERDWRHGHTIPGLPADAASRPADLPRSLSYSNLTRKKYAPSKVAISTARVGLSAAADYLPGVLSTRVGLAPGSHFFYDDIWHDFEVSVPNQLGSRRLLQFHCLELLSGCQVARGMKPELLNAATGRFERLKEKEMLFLFAHVLGNIGYNPEGCVQGMEHGTANVDERVDRLLYDASGGKLTIARGGIQNPALADGLYAGRGKGNFKFKAALESLGNLIHNETGDRLLLPAQVGNNMRLNAPDELHGRNKHLDQLQKCALLLPAHLREIVTAEITPPLHRAIELVDAIQERINDRTDHDLEGWEACGFTRALFRLAPEQAWQPQTQLREMVPAVRAAIEAAILADPRLVKARYMSPREVYTERVRPVLTRLPSHLCIQMIGTEHATERRVGKDGRFHFEDMDLGPGEHHYETQLHTDAGATRDTLRDGERYATFVSTLDPLRLHVCDARGGYLGWVERTRTYTKGDAEGFARAAGKAQAASRARLAPVLAAARPLIERDMQATENANQVLAEVAARAVEQHAATRTATAPKGEAASKQRNRAAQMAAAAAARNEAASAL